MEVLPDWGPIYTETNLQAFPVEPLNTISNIAFLILITYWWRQKDQIQYPPLVRFINIGAPSLFVGYVGGTIYHATRSHLVWMVLDVAPIYILSICASIYHWHLIGLNALKMSAVFLLMIGVPNLLMWLLFPEFEYRHTLGYFFLVLPILLPIIIDQYRLNWRCLVYFVTPLVIVLIALCFRALDSSQWVQKNMTIGTHWLWHLGGALSIHALLVFMRKRAALMDS